MDDDIRQRLEQLRAEIRRHDRLYYVEARPEISDYDYDRLLAALRDLEREYPELVTDDSPTRRVAGEPLTGARFPLLPAFGHRTEVQNSKPLYLADRPEWKRLGLAYGRLRFTVESPAECVSIFRAYREGAAPAGEFTRGLYERGVE